MNQKQTELQKSLTQVLSKFEKEERSKRIRMGLNRRRELKETL